ncbi:MAG: helix-hairpin-helix domain-containing protein [candidate division WOR-3 bacterium]
MLALIFLLFHTLNQDLFETEQEKDFETILFELENLKNNPVDLNTADLRELSKIPFLKPADCLKIIGYREKFGSFETVDGLLKIKGFDREFVELIRPYLTVKTKPFKWQAVQNRLRLQKELDKVGSEEYYTKNIFAMQDYKIFIVTEKDPYESSFLDYYSAGVLIDEGKRKFALGNYNLDFGSGIILSSTGTFFQGTDFRLLTREWGITPYTSTMENGGFFGSALTDTLFINYALFYSNQKLDGRIDTSGYARSFDPSGNHTDSASNAHKDRIREEIFGYNIRYIKDKILLGQTTYWSDYEPSFVCSDSTIGFYGKNYFMTGFNLNYYADRFILFAEFARSFQNRLGSIFGWAGLLPYNFEFNIAGKYFNPGYYAPKGAEADKDYIGLYFDLNNNSPIVHAGTTVNIYTNNQADTNRYDLKFNLGKKIGFTDIKINLRWLYCDDYKEISSSRIFLRFKIKRFLYFDLRLEEKYDYRDSLKRGIFDGVELGIDTRFVDAKCRYGLFDTDSYSTRIYVYEPDLPGIINNRMVYGKGRYGFIYCSIKPTKNISITMKFTLLEKISTKKELGIQLDTKF